jgi:hypothetical protein
MKDILELLSRNINGSESAIGDKSPILLLLGALTVVTIVITVVIHSFIAGKASDHRTINEDLAIAIDRTVDLIAIKSALCITIIGLLDVVILLYDLRPEIMYIMPVAYLVMFLISLLRHYTKSKIQSKYEGITPSYISLIQRPFIIDNITAIMSTIVLASTEFIYKVII